MKKLSAWHYLVIATIPLGLFLSLKFGPLGLLAFSVLNLIICYFCPDSILFQKAPDSVNRLSGKQFYKASSTHLATMSLAIIIIPLISCILVWAFKPQDIAIFLLKWPALDVINSKVKITTAYLVDPSILPNDIREEAQRELEKMRYLPSRTSLYAVVYRLTAYLMLPILIAISTFDRIRAERASFEFNQARRLPLLKRLPYACLFLIILWGLNYLCSAPYVVAYTSRGELGLLICPILLIPFWMVLLSAADAIISRPRTVWTLHPSAYELYQQSRSG